MTDNIFKRIGTVKFSRKLNCLFRKLLKSNTLEIFEDNIVCDTLFFFLLNRIFGN